MSSRTFSRAMCLYTMVLLGSISVAHAGDVPGSKDHAMVSRFPGSEIRRYDYADFDEHRIPTAKNYASFEAVEGKITNILDLGSEATPAEVSRSYTMALEKAGLSKLFECKKQACGVKVLMGLGQLPGGSVLGDDKRYAAYVLERSTGNVYVTVYVADVYDQNKVATFLRVVEAEPLERDLIKVDAKQMQDDISSTGHATLYGVYFDTGKAVLKPASDDTLLEIQKLLKANPGLKILVVGHTDHVGTLAQNTDLSNRRARAVVKALVSRFKVRANRLKSFGAGMYAPIATNETKQGRAKNRRVELVMWSSPRR